MDNFAEYILRENELASKMEIVYYLSKKNKIFFDKSVIFKTEIARMFLNYSKIEVDKNLVLTACLLCNVKKVDNAQDIDSIHTYAKKGAEYLSTLGFDKKFCKMCEEVSCCQEKTLDSPGTLLYDNTGDLRWMIFSGKRDWTCMCREPDCSVERCFSFSRRIGIVFFSGWIVSGKEWTFRENLYPM